MEKIQFTLSQDGETVEFFVLEQTRINGIDYLLVTDSEEEEATAWIMKDLSKPEDAEALYVMVENEEELNYVAQIFAEELGEDALLETE